MWWSARARRASRDGRPPPSPAARRHRHRHRHRSLRPDEACEEMQHPVHAGLGLGPGEARHGGGQVGQVAREQRRQGALAGDPQPGEALDAPDPRREDPARHVEAQLLVGRQSRRRVGAGDVEQHHVAVVEGVLAARPRVHAAAPLRHHHEADVVEPVPGDPGPRPLDRQGLAGGVDHRAEPRPPQPPCGREVRAVDERRAVHRRERDVGPVVPPLRRGHPVGRLDDAVRRDPHALTPVPGPARDADPRASAPSPPRRPGRPRGAARAFPLCGRGRMSTRITVMEPPRLP